MREAIHFSYDNTSSEDIGVFLISQGSGLFEENLFTNRSILEDKSPYSNIPFFHKIEYEPLSFPLRIFIEDWQERDNLDEIARWLFKTDYKPMYFDTNPEKIVFALVEGQSSLKHNGAKEGYFDVNIRCNSPFSYSNVHTVEYEVSNPPLNISIFVDGYLPIKPKVTITKKNIQGDISIENLTTNKISILKNVGVDEIVLIDFEDEEIISSYEDRGVYRYDDFNDEWLELVSQEDNYLIITGACKIKIEYRNAYLTL